MHAAALARGRSEVDLLLQQQRVQRAAAVHVRACSVAPATQVARSLSKIKASSSLEGLEALVDPAAFRGPNQQGDGCAG